MSNASPALAFALSCRGLGKTLGGRTVITDLNLDVAPAEIVALLGGSGSGKTTFLRLAAGLLDPDCGTIHIAGQPMFAPGRSVGPERRPIDMVFQDYALWPHLSVGQNLAFGLEARRLPRKEIDARVVHALEVTRLGPFRDHLPSMLSGGQQQRVAIARCLAARPRLILFDEPLSNLDAGLRDDVRIEVMRLVRSAELTAILVTHDQAEALAVCDRLAVMRAGRIEQIDTPQAVYERPANAFVARFLGGFALLPGHASGTRFQLAGGSPPLQMNAPGPLGPSALVVRPEDACAASIHPENALEGLVLDCAFIGRCWRVALRIGETTVRLDWPMAVAPGIPLAFSLPPSRCHAVPLE